jgi:sulfoxide reductase heme-binding subunit YedZ
VAAETTWLLLRTLGVIALAALTLAVASGLAGPAVRAPAWRGVLVAVHRSAAVVGLALTLGHVAFAVADPWVDVPLSAAVLPGASGWQPWWVGVGAVAVDLLIVVAITSAMRARGPRTWWTLHALTYPAWLLASAHAVAVGADATRAPYTTAGLAGLVVVAVAAAMRWTATRRGRPAGVPARPSVTAIGAQR